MPPSNMPKYPPVAVAVGPGPGNSFHLSDDVTLWGHHELLFRITHNFNWGFLIHALMAVTKAHCNKASAYGTRIFTCYM